MMRDIISETTLEKFLETAPYTEDVINDYLLLADYGFSEKQSEENKHATNADSHSVVFNLSKDSYEVWQRLKSLRDDLENEADVFCYALESALLELNKSKSK